MFMRLFDWFSNTVLFYLEVIFLLKNEKNHHSVPKNVNNIGWYVPYDVAFYYIKKVEIFWFSISNHQSVDVSQLKKWCLKKIVRSFPFFHYG